MPTSFMKGHDRLYFASETWGRMLFDFRPVGASQLLLWCPQVLPYSSFTAPLGSFTATGMGTSFGSAIACVSCIRIINLRLRPDAHKHTNPRATALVFTLSRLTQKAPLIRRR